MVITHNTFLLKKRHGLLMAKISSPDSRWIEHERAKWRP